MHVVLLVAYSPRFESNILINGKTRFINSIFQDQAGSSTNSELPDMVICVVERLEMHHKQ
jgi:hypothetical protein